VWSLKKTYSKEIVFTALSEEAFHLFDFPSPAKKHIPKWYKTMNKYTYNDKKIGISKDTTRAGNSTLKHCMPFRDAMTVGYIWTLPADLEIRKIENNYAIRWLFFDNLVEEHTQQQVPNLPVSVNSDSKNVFKFTCEFLITTPKNYSLLFTHPLNQHDLPFRTFAGIVESDLYKVPVQFPFQLSVTLEENDILIIPKHTPIVQFIPIKRDNWIHKKRLDLNFWKVKKRFADLQTTVFHYYRNKFWIKKEYN
jgi:hypothetical protein